MATDRPMPDAVPVTTAVLPLSEFAFIVILLQDYLGNNAVLLLPLEGIGAETEAGCIGRI